ncbi:unnamed protein product [Ilex paraguariensis]|uniref:VWFA domain-containing protein n=1 Tax=Ilex paraguariensis TaxID=185542 RepID=A0ABC8UFZ0_9AQUA
MQADKRQSLWNVIAASLGVVWSIGDHLRSGWFSVSARLPLNTIYGALENTISLSLSSHVVLGDEHLEVEGFEFLAPTTRRNALRVLRAMQLSKPVLLEGSPGVGKTSLIVALGKFSGHTVVRINLSEQTDIMDLLGSDLPIESDEGMHFAWSDGILLQALKKGSWVLLDELNLAPQSVLEGLNAILDHRAEVFIPELGLTFKCPSSFRIFACQNPSQQGGGRKGLPKSFLNRFTKVFVDELSEEDYLSICSSLYPSIARPILSKLILFNKRLHEDTMIHRKFAGDGSPWEFNLRDVIRSCQIIQGAPESLKIDCFLNTVYVQRMRTSADRREVIRLYEQVFGLKSFANPYPRVQLSPLHLIVGNTCIERNHFQSPKNSDSELKILPAIRSSLEAVAHCVQHQWLCILVGPPSSGKTSLIRLLAQLTGNVLNELNLSSGTDVSELLGCFEQYNAFRNYRLAIARVECYINEYCNLKLESSTEAFERRKDLIAQWLTFLSSIDYGPSTCSTSTHVESRRTVSFDSVSLLVEVIEHLILDVGKSLLPLSCTCKDLSRTLETLRKLQEDYRRRVYPAKFEWVAGLLIKAIENGEWIVLENANLCNPTVLDRINSLVEQSGSITLNECGSVDGKPVVLHPHPRFRMFLTVNPSYGEVSRAMRNRGVEIYVMQPDWLLDEECGENHDETKLKDVKRFLVLSGIPLGGWVDSMAKAHIYAKREGFCLDVSITYLELARWVQLLQGLLTDGNRPIWSLHISWEHIYLSALGETEGKDIVTHAIICYLTIPEPCKRNFFQGCSLCLPGGWPTPLKLRDFVWFSKEACVRQNCMYLEFLGAQITCHTFGMTQCRYPVEQALTARNSMGSYQMDLKMLHVMMFPNKSNEIALNSGWQTGFDLALTKKMFLFAANWTIEQATENDLDFYLLWFSWFGSQLSSFCHIFTSFLTALRQELEHPIWNVIFRCRRELMSDHLVDVVLKPMLSMELVDFSSSDGMLKSCGELLVKAINSVGLLRLSYQQWNAESEYKYNEKTWCFEPLLRLIRGVEKEVLDLIVESPSFAVLFPLYNNLLEDHIQFWNGIATSQYEHLLISWRSLVKDAVKLQVFCPREVENFLEESKNLDGVSSWLLQSQKSLLWIHGGHPFLPSSSDLYHKQHQLLKLCELVWPSKTKSLEIAVNDGLIEAAVSSVPELRFLAMQGVCMSSYIMGEVNKDDINIVQQLEEMYQMLVRRLEHEKSTLQVNRETTEKASFLAELSASCCLFSADVLCQRSGFDSWLVTLPLIDETSFFRDMGLLQELSKIVLVDTEELESALSCLSDHLESALNFSLKFSSRPPTDFSPHQKILWTLDAWTSVDAAKTKVSSFVLEMWFRWHTSLWTICPVVLLKNFPRLDGCDIVLPHMLFQPVKTATTDQILHNTIAIRDYAVHSLKLRVASRNIWHSSPRTTNIQSFFLSTARSLFQQIIFAHKKSFEADKYATIKSIFGSVQEKMMTQADIRALTRLLASSTHSGFISLIDPLVQPLLGELYLRCSSTDVIYSLGCAWLQVGALRYNLLICCDDLDPAVKYSFKYSRLMDKIASLELETEVRKECAYLAGCFSLREADKQRTRLLENLKAEGKRVNRQIVFRSDPGKFKELKYECDEFLKSFATSVDLIKNVRSMDIKQVIDQVHKWQDMATRFIGRLSNEYASYFDIIQPVQVAIYEMKLGLSLLLSSALEKKYLERVGQDDMDVVLGTIYSFMRFPRGCSPKSVSIKSGSRKAKLSYSDIDFPTSIEAVDIDLLENLVTLTSELNTNRMEPVLQLKAAIHRNILLRVAYSIAEAHFMDTASFMLLHKIFDEIASLWLNMKVQVRTKEDHEAQQYKFRPRAFKIQSIVDIDISTLGSLIMNESFLEWQELVYEEELAERKPDEEHESFEEDWNFLEETVLNSMVLIHNQLFGSVDLVQTSGSIEVSDADRLFSFIDSYALGIRMLKDLEGLSSSSLDAKLIPEHLLRLSLDHEQKFHLSHKSAKAYNFYKDSNASMMAKMVEPVGILQQRIASLLKESDDHPALQKILDVTEMILAIPLSTPLAKALSGLQFLLNRVQILQETVAKFPLSGQLEPIFVLVSSWQKLEFESWPALLDEVQSQFETNAGKLWFPLHSILQHRDSTDIDEYRQSTIQSLEEFIQTSSIGEFRKRLQLLFAFHGQIINGICRGSYSSPFLVENVKILYNIFGFYVQLLPRILEHIEGNRRRIEMELKEFLKLCRWEHSESYLTMENSKRTRKKFRKIIQKYTVSDALSGLQFLLNRVQILQETVAKFPLSGQLEPIFVLVSSWQKLEFESWPALLDEVQSQFETNAGKLWFPLHSILQHRDSTDIDEYRQSTIQRHVLSFTVTLILIFRTDLLQQPVMLMFNQEAARMGIKTQSVQGPNPLSVSYDRNGHMLDVACSETQFRDTHMSVWFADWKKKVYLVLQNLHLGRPITEFGISSNYSIDEEVASIFRDCILSQSSHLVYQEESNQVWHTIEKICRTAIDCGELWKDEKKSFGKRRALSVLLKLLDNCGLSKHRSTFLEFGINQSSWWLLQPSYDVQHLLLTQGRLSNGDGNVAALSQFQNAYHESFRSEWKAANEYYFKSMASVHLLRQICLNFHKDFTLEQVNRSGSYLDHLISIQQEQRAAAYDFSEQLNGLRKCIFPLENLFSNSISSCESSSESFFIQNQHVSFECMWKQKQLFDSVCAMLHDGSLLLKKIENNHLNTCQNVEAAAKRFRLFIEKFVPDFQKSKDLLDNYLLGRDRVITTMGALLCPFGITKQMEQLIYQNFQFIREFEQNLRAFCKQDLDEGSVKEALLAHFEDIFEKNKLFAEEYNSAVQEKNQLETKVEVSNNCGEKVSELEAGFGEALEKTYKHIVDAFRSVGSLKNDCVFSNDSLVNITNLRLSLICDELGNTIQFAVDLVNHYGSANPSLCFLVGSHLKHLYSLLDLILTYSNALLHDFLVMHRTVSIMSHALANIFASLYSKGFGISTEDQMDETGHDTQDAKGTGMGEGAGLNDVSDQISDEDQLLGITEKPNEEQDTLPDVPSKTDKGIEMEEDFAAETFSVSEESGDDDSNDGQDEQLESAMGDTGVDSEIVDEKLWDKDDDENPSRTKEKYESGPTKEKYESGPSVKDKDSSGRELRAKEDSATSANEVGELDRDGSDKQNDANGNEDGPDGTDDIEDMNVDKEDGFSDPTGIELNKPDQGCEEDIDMDEIERADPMEDAGSEELDQSDEGKNGDEEKANSMDEILDEAESDRFAENSEREGLENNHEKIKKDMFEPGTSNLVSDNVPNAESATQPGSDSLAADVENVAPDAKWSNCNDIQNNLAPMSGLPNAAEIEIAIASEGGKLSEHQSRPQLSQLDSSSLQKIQPNPCRNVGDALEGWKERVKVSVDLQENNVAVPDDMMDENADEYGFTSKLEKGASQALGPAASDQIDRNINLNDLDGDGITADRKDHSEMDTEQQHSEAHPSRSYALNTGNKIEAQTEMSDLEKQPEGSPEFYHHHDGDLGSISDSLVSLKKPDMSDGFHQGGELFESNDELGKASNIEDMSSNKKDYATTLWRKYELLTTRLSQELAEQLRLVMEPTLASKLQGDYRTGKRINMKKVISYIASHYRKDKIWLRRTRPNKRDYQVIIAVDDSRSMSESCCGDVAVEALVTVCRAMSQLEVGNLAVASFGKKGNIKLLHDFDQPFTGEAGIKMISSLTFKQENTIADEPMIDLLKYLKDMLDAAVANARLPSGHNPLQQLVLIIADGRFHEKENLKRCVRNILSNKRMVAFLLLDSPQESIMDLMEASFQGGNVKFSKYLDSFPFPYYVVLKNIEALPRTLADLLRQWFELMQYSRD